MDGHKHCQMSEVMRWMDTNCQMSAGHEMEGHKHCQMSAGHEMDGHKLSNVCRS